MIQTQDMDVTLPTCIISLRDFETVSSFETFPHNQFDAIDKYGGPSDIL